MTLSEHLSELRVRLIRASIALALAFTVLYVNRQPVWEFIRVPYRMAWEDLHEELLETRQELVAEDPDRMDELFVSGPPDWEMRNPEKDLASPQSLKPGGAFFLKIRISLLLAFFIAGPVLLLEVWMFVAAGLYKREKRVVYAFLPPSVLLFFAGVAFGYYYMTPAAIFFTNADGLGVDDIKRQMDVDEYLGFLRSFSLAMGIVFQIPIVQLALSRAGLVAPRAYATYRGHMAVGALVFAAIITPPDPITQILLAGPAIVLWEIGYWCSRLVWKEPMGLTTLDDFEPSGV